MSAVAVEEVPRRGAPEHVQRAAFAAYQVSLIPTASSAKLAVYHTRSAVQHDPAVAPAAFDALEAWFDAVSAPLVKL